MEQRPLRLGDIVDDYCPRERRLTNHAIVAIVEQTIRQTRCTTCDAEHVYKEGRVPRRRRKDEDGATDAAAGQLVSPRAAAVDEPAAAVAAAPAGADNETVAPDVPAVPMAASAEAPVERVAPVENGPVENTDDAPPRHDDRDIWPAHRQLIRATLPRSVDAEPTPRPIPEFTMHQRPQGRGFRQGQGWYGGNGGGSRNGHGPERNGNVMPGHGGGGGGGGRHRRRRHKRGR